MKSFGSAPLLIQPPYCLKNNYNSKYINPILTTPDFNRILDSTLDSQRILKLLHIDQPSLYSVLMI